MKRVSIAVCTYNGEKYLREQINSLIHQTYQNLEIIIVDDKSSDNTLEILKSYAQKDERIKLFQNEHNLGFVQNFSKALTRCSGDYIALADQDDIWKLNKIEKFLSEIQEHTLIYSDALLIDQNSNPMNQQLIQPKKNLVSGNCNKAFIFTNCVSGNTLMFKKELLPFILPIPHISFHDTWIAFVASSMGTITYTDEAMTYYRRHNEQITIKKKSHRSFNIPSILKRKTYVQLENTHAALRDWNAYQQLAAKIHDSDMTTLLDMLIRHNTNYDKTYINIALRKLLIKDADKIFAILPKSKRIRKAKRTAYGLKFHTSTFFLFA